MKKNVILLILLLLALPLFAEQGKQSEQVGNRPYEMDWAGRVKDEDPPFIDFESQDPWTIESKNTVVTFERSREQQLFGQYVRKLTYRQTKEVPEIVLRPKSPMPLPDNGFDAMSLWIYGNNWDWENDITTPQILIEVLFKLADGKEIAIPITRVRWKEWFLCHWRFTDAQYKELHHKGTTFNGFRIQSAMNKEDRVVYFDNFSLFKEPLEPLQLSRRPKRGIDMFPGQDPGLYTGEGRLPFPTREETILPESKAAGAKNRCEVENGVYRLVYEGKDGTLILNYKPEKGNWSDLTAQWNGSAPFSPLSQGGINTLVTPDGQTEKVTSCEHLGTERKGNKIATRWKLVSDHGLAEVQYDMELNGKSLVLDTFCPGGKAAAVEFGTIRGIEHPRAFAIPYYSYGGPNRPYAIVFGLPNLKESLFILANVDWYRSNGSNLKGAGNQGSDFATTSGEVTYIAKTDGKRNDVFERFFITISPKFDEILPTIANPQSPWKHVTGKGVWYAHGAGNREGDKKFWYNVWRHGMRHVIVTDHETGWRDGGESFTFRTKPAPKKGGDQGQNDYARFMQDKLGFVYGPYNNYTDFAPVNEFWNYDMVSRTPSRQLGEAWARCYAPKPSKSIEYCEKIIPVIQKKFNFSTAYCDVHTAVTPWSRTDYDARVPGAGTFAATYYPFGEIMLQQKKTWNGPVYSEGAHHCYYSGLTDGNYAQDWGYYFPGNPWLVDFDLLKMHDLECDFGMGSPSMYDHNMHKYQMNDLEWSLFIDRYIAAILAFGHPGFLVTERGMPVMMNAYFIVQQIASRYTQSSVEKIRYLDATGKEYTTSEALAADLVKENRVAVLYKDGTRVFVNGHKTESTKVPVEIPVRDRKSGSISQSRQIKDVPPGGFVALTKNADICVEGLTANDARYNYCDSPEYIFLDARGSFQERTMAMGSGLGVCRKLPQNRYEIIIPGNAEMGFAIDANSAIAKDFNDKELGKAEVRRSGDMLFVKPVPNAFSYVLEKRNDVKPLTHVFIPERSQAVPGESVVITDRNNPSFKKEVTVPADAAINQFHWFDMVDGQSVALFVCPLTNSHLTIMENNTLVVEANCNLPENPQLDIALTLNGKSVPAVQKSFDNQGKYKTKVTFTLPEAKATGTDQVAIAFSSGSFRQTMNREITIVQEIERYLPIFYGDKLQTSILDPVSWCCLRGQTPTRDLAKYLAVTYREKNLISGNQLKQGWFLHPPYQGGVGKVWLEYTLTVPNRTPVFFAAFVGKGDNSAIGDGILNQIVIVDSQKKEKTLAEVEVTKHQWYPIRADLAPYAGQTVTLRLISDVGKANDSSGDWSCWGEPRLESGDKVFIRRLK